MKAAVELRLYLIHTSARLEPRRNPTQCSSRSGISANISTPKNVSICQAFLQNRITNISETRINSFRHKEDIDVVTINDILPLQRKLGNGHWSYIAGNEGTKGGSEVATTTRTEGIEFLPKKKLPTQVSSTCARV